MAIFREPYPPALMSRVVPDPLTLYIQIDLLVCRLVSQRLEQGPQKERDALMTKLAQEQERIGELGVWN